MLFKNLFINLLLLISLSISSHGKVGSFIEPDGTGNISFPNTDEYQVLSVDLHTHSVFSDGHVWPNVRVAEAERENIDLIAITEHLEFQPHIEDIPHPDRNRSYEIALDAKNSDLLIVNGSEITRSFPPGHINAVFVKDANKLINIDRSKQDKVDEWKKTRPPSYLDKYDGDPWFNDAALAALWPIEDVLKEANRQGAFVFWNHPVWSAETDNSDVILTDMHKNLFNKKLMHGIEVVNGRWFSDEAFQIALDYNLTLLGTSDIHGLIEWDYLNQPNGHRPVTLVLAKKRTTESIKEALFAGRTVIWYKNDLIGLEKNLVPVIESTLEIVDVTFKGRTIGTVKVKNISNVRYMLRVVDGQFIEDSSNIIFIEPNDTSSFEVKYAKGKKISLEVEVLNAYIKPKIHPVITLN